MDCVGHGVAKSGTRLSDFQFTFTVESQSCANIASILEHSHQPRNEPVTVGRRRLCPHPPSPRRHLSVSASVDLTALASTRSLCDWLFRLAPCFSGWPVWRQGSALRS